MATHNPLNVFDGNFNIETQYEDDICPICGANINIDTTVCPNCKEILRSDDLEFEDENDQTPGILKQEKKNNKAKTIKALNGEKSSRPAISELLIWSISGTLIFSLLSLIFSIIDFESLENNKILQWGSWIELSIILILGVATIIKLKKNSYGNIFLASVFIIGCLYINIISVIISSLDENLVSGGNSFAGILICVFFLGCILRNKDLNESYFSHPQRQTNLIFKGSGILFLLYILIFNTYCLISMI